MSGIGRAKEAATGRKRRIKRRLLPGGVSWRQCLSALMLAGLGLAAPCAGAGDQPLTTPAGLPASTAVSAGAVNHRYMLGLLDERSTYGTFWFPEPLLGGEMDVDREVRVDYFHGEHAGLRSDKATGEFEYAAGQLTLEAEVPYEREVSGGATTAGLGAVELSARHPVFEYVAPGRSWDYTVVAGLEAAIPTRTRVSRDTEVVPKLAKLARLGKHVSVQTNVGYSMLFGPDEGGARTLEYSAAFGYDLDYDDLPLPGVAHFVPQFGLKGTRGLRGPDSGLEQLFGVVGARLDMKSFAWLAPQLRPGVGFVFPLDAGARREERWGVIMSLVFEY